MIFLLSFDTKLFLAINHLPHTTATEAIALTFSSAGSLGFVWFLLAGILFLFEERKHHLFFLPIGLAGVLSGVVTNLVLKPLVARPRPDQAIGAIIVGNGLSDFSFPSGHATMSFAAAVVLSRTEPRWKAFFYILAILISLSRVYVGKHYPLDVLMGVLLGWCIGHGSLYATQRKTATHH